MKLVVDSSSFAKRYVQEVGSDKLKETNIGQESEDKKI